MNSVLKVYSISFSYIGKKPNNITRMALKWNIKGSRNRGTQKPQRLNDLTWEGAKRTAENRVSWRCFVEAMCSLERFRSEW